MGRNRLALLAAAALFAGTSGLALAQTSTSSSPSVERFVRRDQRVMQLGDPANIFPAI